MWADFSAWLVTVGVIMGWLAAIAGADRFSCQPRHPHAGARLARTCIGNLVVLALGDRQHAGPHARRLDLGGAVGTVLSAPSVLILLFTGWMGWSMVYRYRVGGRAMSAAMIGQKRAALALVCAISAGARRLQRRQRFDVASQIGPNPKLPEPQQYLFPPMHLAKVVGWKEGENAHRCRRPARSRRWRPACSIRARFTCCRTATCWSSNRRAAGRSRSSGRKIMIMGLIESWVTSGGDEPARATASPCCATPTATASRRRGPSSSIISTRHSASRWSATTSMSPTPTRSCITPTTTGDTKITATRHSC